MATYYECMVTETEHFRDEYNRHDSITDRWIEQAETLKELYEKLAQIQLRETPEEKRGDEYTTIEFGSIREIRDPQEFEVTLDRLKATKVWQEHERELREKAEQEEAEQRARATARAAAQEARERAELERLVKKYGKVLRVEGPE